MISRSDFIHMDLVDIGKIIIQQVVLEIAKMAPRIAENFTRTEKRRRRAYKRMKRQQVTGDNEFISPFPNTRVQHLVVEHNIILSPDLLNACCPLERQNLGLENLIAMKERQLAVVV
jgi:signal-transduction protein with cAMP-binding, CBS, and nucleotidyltransferase domain